MTSKLVDACRVAPILSCDLIGILAARERKFKHCGRGRDDFYPSNVTIIPQHHSCDQTCPRSDEQACARCPVIPSLRIGCSEDAPASSGPQRTKTARRNRGNLPEELPRIEQVIEPASLVCPCGCGSMHRIGEDRCERLDIVPAQLRVIVTVRPKYACRACAEGITQAPAPAHLIEGGLPTEGVIAHVLVAKFAAHLPFCDRVALVNGGDAPASRSILLSVVGSPPQDADCGGR